MPNVGTFSILVKVCSFVTEHKKYKWRASICFEDKNIRHMKGQKNVDKKWTSRLPGLSPFPKHIIKLSRVLNYKHIQFSQFGIIYNTHEPRKLREQFNGNLKKLLFLFFYVYKSLVRMK